MSEDRCPDCSKPRNICVCDRLVPLATRTRVLILQHPQEGNTDLTTTPLLARGLTRAVVRVGLSWASLARALNPQGPLGEEADHARWGVIYPTKLADDIPKAELEKSVLFLDKKGRLRAEETALEGVVVLDGTWSQAKTLWWRNPWVLKLGRILVNPREPSIYGRVRKEPRREYVSTLEAVGDVLTALGEPEEVRLQLRRAMRTMVQRARDATGQR